MTRTVQSHVNATLVDFGSEQSTELVDPTSEVTGRSRRSTPAQAVRVAATASGTRRRTIPSQRRSAPLRLANALGLDNPYGIAGGQPAASLGTSVAYRWCHPHVLRPRRPQGSGGAGLPALTATNPAIEDTDGVRWYAFGMHRVPRPEDWPVMTVDIVSVSLKPSGSFDRKSALDVLPSTDRCAFIGGQQGRQR